MEQKKSKLQEMFKEYGEKLTDIEYRHPDEDTIIESLHSVLSKSKTGTHLLGVVAKYNIPFHVISSSEINGFAPEGKAVFLSFPPTEKQANPALIFEAVAAIRDIEQDMLGYKRQPAEKDPLEFAAMSHAKNLDIILHMCKVAHELGDGAEDTPYTQQLEMMGHGGLYDAYVRDFASKDMVGAYYGQKS